MKIGSVFRSSKPQHLLKAGAVFGSTADYFCLFFVQVSKRDLHSVHTVIFTFMLPTLNSQNLLKSILNNLFTLCY